MKENKYPYTYLKKDKKLELSSYFYILDNEYKNKIAELEKRFDRVYVNRNQKLISQINRELVEAETTYEIIQEIKKLCEERSKYHKKRQDFEVREIDRKIELLTTKLNRRLENKLEQEQAIFSIKQSILEHKQLKIK